jgi:chitosanase
MEWTLNARNHGVSYIIDCGSGNPDGQPLTNFGALSAFNVPWVVVPDSFFQQSDIPPNAISAVVCDGKVFYGIMGDTDADDPEVIGEASFLMGQTCFPTEDLGGDNGHTSLDVLCFVSWIVRTDCRPRFYRGIPRR